MKYLAFDIEAANGYKLSSVCSIGVVIADEHFNVTSRQNIWINPKTKYNLNGTRENVGINLELDKALLDASPDFSQVYSKVRALLTDKDYLVLYRFLFARNDPSRRYHAVRGQLSCGVLRELFHAQQLYKDRSHQQCGKASGSCWHGRRTDGV